MENANEDESRTSSTSHSGKPQQTQTNNSLVAQMRNGVSLFRRVPTLGALFFEALTFQSLSTILNTCLVTQLKDAVPNDADRAAWTGKFYASVNGLSTGFQFFVMPTLSKYVEPKALWRLMPILPFVCGVVQCIPASVLPDGFGMSSSSSALYLIALSFLVSKTMDYSLRNILAEMAYMPLSFDARFKGKEIVAVFANRFGKSGMALILSGLHFSSGGKVGLSGLSLAVSVAWLSSVVCLSNLIPSKEEAERLVAERNKSDDDKGERKKRR
jgi:ATP/ADP translocase